METKERSKFSLVNPKLKKTILTLIAVLLTFAGPTYVVFVLKSVIDYIISAVLGFILFLIGFILLIYLFRERKATT